MKLLKCYIENFGILHEYSHIFENGLNTIKENNGFGKTTFATFIKSMFYGLDISNKTEKSDRVKYKPWQGGNFGGNIEFEVNNKKYRIERYFGLRAQNDTFKLIDLYTNLESSDYSENIGEEIFQISKEAFERSTYIPQGKIQIEMEDSISAKLGNVLESDNDIQTSDNAIKNIEDVMKVYKKTGGRGIINSKKGELNNLKREYEKTKFDEDNLNLRKQKLNEIKERIFNLELQREEKQKIVEKKIEIGRKQAKKETYNNIINKLNSNKQEYMFFNEIFKNEFSNLMNNNQKIIKMVEFSENIDKNILEYSKIKEYDLKIQKQENELEIVKQKIKNLQDKRKKEKIFIKYLCVLFIIFLVIGLGLFLPNINKIIGIISIILSIILLFFLGFKVKNKKIKQKLEDIIKKADNLEKEHNKLKSEKNVIEKFIKDFIQNYNQNNLDIIVLLSDLKTKATQFINILKQLEENEKIKYDFEQKNNINELNFEDNLSEFNEKELNVEIKAISYELDKLIDEKNQFKNQIEILENKIDDNEFLEIDINKLEEEIKNDENRYLILKQTKEYLGIAKENFTASYLNEMTASYMDFLHIIDDKKLDTSVDINLDVKIDVGGTKKEVKYFSTGYKDLIYICMRLSLIKALFKEELPFIILDDPFVNLDEDKTEKVLNLLKNISEKYQVIYFICNSSRKGLEKK